MASRKKFISVELPLINETLSVLGTPESLHGKTIKLDMSRRLRGKGLELVFKIQTQGEKLIGIPKKLELIKSYIRRMLRKRADYVEDSFQTNSKDIRVIVKPFLITRKKVSRAVQKNLRNTAREFLIEKIKQENYLDICEKILSGELQKAMLPKLKKVYPLSFCDIRIFETKDLDKLKSKEEKPKKDKEEETRPKKVKEKETSKSTKDSAKGERFALDKSKDNKSESGVGLDNSSDEKLGGHVKEKKAKPKETIKKEKPKSSTSKK